MVNKIDFSQFNQNRAKSFNDQRALIKRLAKGKTVPCQGCGLPLQLTLHSEGESRVSCKQGCMVIHLELADD